MADRQRFTPNPELCHFRDYSISGGDPWRSAPERHFVFGFFCQEDVEGQQLGQENGGVWDDGWREQHLFW